jgi:hypothetical protein
MSTNHRLTSSEIAACGEREQIVAVAGIHKDSETFLRFVFRTGDTQIVSLDESAASHLVAVLKTLVPSFQAIEGLGLTVSSDGAVSAQSP